MLTLNLPQRGSSLTNSITERLESIVEELRSLIQSRLARIEELKAEIDEIEESNAALQKQVQSILETLEDD